MEAQLLPTVVALVVGLLSVPICFGYTLLCESLPPLGMLGLAVAILAGVLAIFVFLTKGKVKNKMYYGKIHIRYINPTCPNTKPDSYPTTLNLYFSTLT
jgi:hypothetical protein